MSLALGAALGSWAGAIAWNDWATRRIPNRWLLAALLPALLFLLLQGQGLLGSGPLASAAGALLALAALLPAYARGWLGGGDVKFAACLGVLLGGMRTVELLLFSAIGLGAISAMAMAYSHVTAPSQPLRRVAAGPVLAAVFVAEMLGGPWLVA